MPGSQRPASLTDALQDLQSLAHHLLNLEPGIAVEQCQRADGVAKFFESLNSPVTIFDNSEVCR